MKKTTHTFNTHELIYNNHFYKYIFKKTEKITGAVLYIKDKSYKNDALFDEIEKTSLSLLETSSACLMMTDMNAVPILRTLLAGCAKLDSYLSILKTRGMIASDIADTIKGELEGLMRSIGQYIQPTQVSFKNEERDEQVAFSQPVHEGEREDDITPRTPSAVGRTPRVEKRTDGFVAQPASHTTETGGSTTASQGQRKDLIVEIMSQKGTVSIKDISDVIKDCSEKTIQRDLNELIDKDIITRFGKRRWSTYSLKET